MTFLTLGFIWSLERELVAIVWDRAWMMAPPTANPTQ
jgi:hypothetical protein